MNSEDALTNLLVLCDDGECAAWDAEADVRDVHPVDNYPPTGLFHEKKEGNSVCDDLPEPVRPTIPTSDKYIIFLLSKHRVFCRFI